MPTTGKIGRGYLKVATSCTQKAKEEASIGQISFAARLGGLRMPVRLWQLEKATMATDFPRHYKVNPSCRQFEKAHGPGYVAVFVFENSSGHSVYAPDALVVFSRLRCRAPGEGAAENVR